MTKPFVLKPNPGDVGIVRGAQGRFQSAVAPTPQDIADFAESKDVSNAEAMQALRVPDRDGTADLQPVETTGTAAKAPPVMYPETNPFPPERPDIPFRLR